MGGYILNFMIMLVLLKMLHTDLRIAVDIPSWHYRSSEILQVFTLLLPLNTSFNQSPALVQLGFLLHLSSTFSLLNSEVIATVSLLVCLNLWPRVFKTSIDQDQSCEWRVYCLWACIHYFLCSLLIETISNRKKVLRLEESLRVTKKDFLHTVHMLPQGVIIY